MKQIDCAGGYITEEEGGVVSYHPTLWGWSKPRLFRIWRWLFAIVLSLVAVYVCAGMYRMVMASDGNPLQFTYTPWLDSWWRAIFF